MKMTSVEDLKQLTGYRIESIVGIPGVAGVQITLSHMAFPREVLTFWAHVEMMVSGFNVKANPLLQFKTVQIPEKQEEQEVHP